MDNYYERLEVSPKASPEIIEKAYRVLAKRYHPDMHEEAKKEWAEAEFKKINEAYEVLSNDEKRKEYDTTIAKEKDENYQELMQEINTLKAELKKYKRQEENNVDIETTQNSNKEEQAEEKKDNDTIYQNFYNYYQSYRPKQTTTQNYSSKEDWLITKIKGIFSILLTIIIVIAVAAILWAIPFTRNWLQGIYNENEGIKMIVDIFIK